MSFPVGANLIGGKNAAPIHAASAREFYLPIIPIVVELRGKGLSLRDIARELGRRGITPRYGYSNGWSASQVRRALLRAAEQAEVQQPTAAGNAASEILTTVDISAEIQARQSPTSAPPALPTPPRTADEPAQADIALWHNWDRYLTKDEIKAMLTQGTVTSTTLYCRKGTSCWRPLHELFNDIAGV